MNEPRPIPDALLERYLQDDLSPDLKADVEARLAASPAEKARLDELRADSAAFFIAHPPAPLAARIFPEKEPSRWVTWFSVALAGATAASLAVATFRPPPVEDDRGIKGTAAFTVHRQTSEGSVSVTPGSTLHEGDTIGFEVRAPKEGYVAVLSRDGAGQVTVYFPSGERNAAPYSPKDPVLRGAIKLDATPGAETAWLLFSTQPFALTPFLERLEQTGRLETAGGVEVSNVNWLK